MTQHRTLSKVVLTIACAAGLYLISDAANSQTLPSAEKAVSSSEKLNLQLQKDTLKSLKAESKARKEAGKVEKEMLKLEKINKQIAELCKKPHMLRSETCISRPAI
jgi:hypothetical protein